MWLKLFFLLLYVLLLFAAARLMEALAWCEPGLPGLPSCSSYSCRLLDPVLMSVVQLKALLDQRGLSYEGVVEKSELTALVSASGQVSVEEAKQSHLEHPSDGETNFTSGAHFIEQVEDAKDSVWLVQVSSHPDHGGQVSHLMGEARWKSLKRKMARFGVRMGRLDCSLDYRYCRLKNWHSPFVLLALPSQHQKKASVAMYNFSSSSVRETALTRWVRDKLDERVDRITDTHRFILHWQNLGQKDPLESEIRVALFTSSNTTPLFYSALSVKFPGRVKFGLVSVDPSSANYSVWQGVLKGSGISKLPAYVIYTAESNYTYGFRPGEHYSFISMERFLKTLYPCLNDVFIISFCLANAISWLELLVSNCSPMKRLKKFSWCVFKYNMMVILLWLPVIAVFQMPYLDRFPLLALKCVRLFSTSTLGQMIRGDYHWYMAHFNFLLATLVAYLLTVAKLCAKYRAVEADEDSNDWFNFSQMRTLTHLRPNDFFEPMRIGGYGLLGGMDVFGSRLSQPSLWLPPPISPDYIQHLPTWKFNPVPLAVRAQANVEGIQAVLMSGDTNSMPSQSHAADTLDKSKCSNGTRPSVSRIYRNVGDQSLRSVSDLSCSGCACVTSNSNDMSGQGSHVCTCRLCSSSTSHNQCQASSQEMRWTGYNDESGGEQDRCNDCELARAQTAARMCGMREQGFERAHPLSSGSKSNHQRSPRSSACLPPNAVVDPPRMMNKYPTSSSCSNIRGLPPHSTENPPSISPLEQAGSRPPVHTCAGVTTPNIQPETTKHRIGCSRNPHIPDRSSVSGSTQHPHNPTDPGTSSVVPSQPITGSASPCDLQSKSSEQGSSNMRETQLPPVAAAQRQGSGFPLGYLESQQCVICLDDYAPLTSLCGLPCGHVFHETCIISWLNLDKHFCPVCRWPSFRSRPSQPL